MSPTLTVAPSPATRALGLLGILGGAWLAAWILPFLPWGPEWVNLRLIALNLGAVAIVIALARRLPASSHVALAISAAALLSNLWYLAMVVFSVGRPVLPEPDPGFRLVMFWAGVAMWLADMAFGAMATRFGGVARWGALALAVGSALGFLGMDRLGLVQGQYRENRRPPRSRHHPPARLDPARPRRGHPAATRARA